MVYTRPRSESVAKRYFPIEIPENKLQFCCPESDLRIRALIRGMDDRERMIIQDELNRIKEEAPTLGY